MSEHEITTLRREIETINREIAARRAGWSATTGESIDALADRAWSLIQRLPG